MTDWRSSASEEAQADLDGLTGLTLEFATEQVGTHGAVAPFAIVTGTDGATRQVMVDDDADAATLVALLTAQVREQRDDIRAAAFVADVTAEQLGGDAVRVLLEHQDGIALAVYLPYTITGSGAEFGQLVAGVGAHQIWS